MPGPILPAKLAKFDQWTQTFNGKINATTPTPTTGSYLNFAISYPQALMLLNATSAFHAAYQACQTTDKSKKLVGIQRETRLNLNAVLKPIKNFLSLTPLIPLSTKIDLGLNPHTNKPSRISAPDSGPLFTIEKSDNNQLTVLLRNKATPTSKARPYGSKGAHVFMRPTGAPAGTTWQWLKDITRSPADLDFAPAMGGMTFDFYAVWYNGRGETSPPSEQRTATIPLVR